MGIITSNAPAIVVGTGAVATTGYAGRYLFNPGPMEDTYFGEAAYKNFLSHKLIRELGTEEERNKGYQKALAKYEVEIRDVFNLAYLNILKIEEVEEHTEESKRQEAFKNYCLTKEDKSKNTDLFYYWCTQFESIGENFAKDNKIFDESADESTWKSRYDTLVKKEENKDDFLKETLKSRIGQFKTAEDNSEGKAMKAWCLAYSKKDSIEKHWLASMGSCYKAKS